MKNKRTKILLIEDNPGDVRLIEEMLKEVMPIGFDVIRSQTLEHSLRKLQKQQFDVIILDLGLPDSQGINTLEKLLPNARDSTVIVLTGLADEKVGIQVVRNGAQDYLIKENINASMFGKSLQYAIERKKAEKALLRSERLLKEAQALGRIGNWVFDLATQKITWSDEVYVLYERDKNLGPPSVEEEARYYPEEQAKKLSKYVKLVVETGQECRYDLVAKLPSGKTCFFDALMHPVKDDGGRVVKLFGTVQDITDRKRAEDTLRASEGTYRTLLENLPQKIFFKDRNSVYVSCNKHYAMDLKIDPAGIHGKTDYDFYPKELAEKYRGDDKRIMESGDMEELEERYKQEGRERWVHTVKTPVKDEQGGIVGILGIFWDITERKRAEETLRKVMRALKTLSSSNEALVRAIDETELLRDICRTITEVGGYRMAWVGYPQQDANKTVHPVAYAGYEEGYLGAVKTTWANDKSGCGPTGMAIRTGKPCICRNLQTVPDHLSWRRDALDRGYASTISLPLMVDVGQIIGALTIYSDEPESFDDEEVKLLTELADDLAYGIKALRTRVERRIADEQLNQSVEKLRATLEKTVNALASAVGQRDPYTASHQIRVTRLECAIALEMGLPSEQIDGIRIAGLLHDIGKISVPAEILSKPTKLTEAEFSIVKTHCQIGHDILKDIEFPWPITRIVLQHHERLNGSGYPGGLKGDAILIEARILAVADVVEAMTSHRPYRPARGIDAALDEISKNRGVLYDTTVVGACLKLFKERGFKLE